MERRSLIQATVKSRVLEAFQISHEQYDRTFKHFSKNPQYANVLTNLDQMIKDRRIQASQTKPITKTQTIQAMKTVESKKVDIIAKIQKGLKSQNISPAQVPMITEVNTCKIFDKLFADTGFEQDDVYAGLLKYQLNKTELLKDLPKHTKEAVTAR